MNVALTRPLLLLFPLSRSRVLALSLLLFLSLSEHGSYAPAARRCILRHESSKALASVLYIATTTSKDLAYVLFNVPGH